MNIRGKNSSTFSKRPYIQWECFQSEKIGIKHGHSKLFICSSLFTMHILKLSIISKIYLKQNISGFKFNVLLFLAPMIGYFSLWGHGIGGKLLWELLKFLWKRFYFAEKLQKWSKYDWISVNKYPLLKTNLKLISLWQILGGVSWF